jgi:hypothetical protein
VRRLIVEGRFNANCELLKDEYCEGRSAIQSAFFSIQTSASRLRAMNQISAISLLQFTPQE